MLFFYIEVNFCLFYLICFVFFLLNSVIMKVFYFVLFVESEEWFLKCVYVLRLLSKFIYINLENKLVVMYIIYIRCKWFYYFVYFIVFCMMMLFMMLILFIFFFESGERMVVGVIILLLFIVFYLLVFIYIFEILEVVLLILR